LIKAVRNLAGYRGEASLMTWLTQICRHELADSCRKAARRPGHDSLDEPDVLLRLSQQLLAPTQLEPAAAADAESYRGAVIRALNSLPERYALALEAKYGDGLSVDEIAHLLGLTSVAAQSLLARAREAFRERWLEDSDDRLDGIAQYD
jgi:RNA polymerase sigma-70 factor, ECF subfamily